MNLDQLTQNLGLDKDEVAELLHLFLTASRSDLEGLRSAVARGAADQTRELAHSLKGAALNFEFHRIHELAKAIEMRAKARSLEGSTADMDAIEQELEAIERALDG